MTRKKTRAEKSKKLYLELVDSIKKQGKLPESHKETDLSYYRRKLKRGNVIVRISDGTWALGHTSIHTFLEGLSVKKKGRGTCSDPIVNGHASSFTLLVPTSTKWKNREKVLKRKNIKYELSKSQPGVFRIKFRERKIWLCNDKIIVYPQKNAAIYGPNGQYTKIVAMREFQQVVMELEVRLDLKLNTRGKYDFKMTGQHQAFLNHPIAKWYIASGRGLKIKDTADGKMWALIDHSPKGEVREIHFETIGELADEDMDKIVITDFNDMRTEFREMGSFTTRSQIRRMISEVQFNQGQHDEKLHNLIKAFQSLIESQTEFLRQQNQSILGMYGSTTTNKESISNWEEKDNLWKDYIG